MAEVFEIKTHVIEAGHIRDYPHATAHSQEDVLHLAIKQYIPKDNPNPQHGDVTIIAAHANGFVKELYEPLWMDMYEALRKRGVRIRGIWMAEAAWQGESGVVNEQKLGNDPSWIDYARDLLHMVNHFRRSMPLPLVGIGHSFGANAMVNLALLHPRLLATLVLVDPVMADFTKRGPEFGFVPMTVTSPRRDLWPSRADAAAAFARSTFYQAWDPRVLAIWNEHGLRDTPTKLYPRAPAGSVTLKTTKHQEVFTYGRPVEQDYDAQTGRRVQLKKKAASAASAAASASAGGGGAVVSAKLPDLDHAVMDSQYPDWPFYRPEGYLTTLRLPTLRPSAFYVYGEDSMVCGPEVREEKRQLTGVGLGGSGGVAAGRVADVTLPDLGHLLPLEAPRKCAEHAAGWLVPELERWRKEDEVLQAWYRNKEISKDVMDEDWLRWMQTGKEMLKTRPKI